MGQEEARESAYIGRTGGRHERTERGDRGPCGRVSGRPAAGLDGACRDAGAAGRDRRNARRERREPGCDAVRRLCGCRGRTRPGTHPGSRADDDRGIGGVRERRDGACTGFRGCVRRGAEPPRCVIAARAARSHSSRPTGFRPRTAGGDRDRMRSGLSPRVEPAPRAGGGRVVCAAHLGSRWCGGRGGPDPAARRRADGRCILVAALSGDDAG